MSIGDGIALGCCMLGISHLTAWLMRLRQEDERYRQQRQMIAETQQDFFDGLAKAREKPPTVRDLHRGGN